MKFFIILTTLFTIASCNKQEETTQDKALQVEKGSCICYEIYAPVCGSDGKTYPNDCFAGCAGVSFTEGECQ